MRWAVCGFQLSVFPLPPSAFRLFFLPLIAYRLPPTTVQVTISHPPANFKIAASNLNCNARQPAAAGDVSPKAPLAETADFR